MPHVMQHIILHRPPASMWGWGGAGGRFGRHRGRVLSRDTTPTFSETTWEGVTPHWVRPADRVLHLDSFSISSCHYEFV